MCLPGLVRNGETNPRHTRDQCIVFKKAHRHMGIVCFCYRPDKYFCILDIILLIPHCSTRGYLWVSCLFFIAFLTSIGLPEVLFSFSVFKSAKWADEDDKGPSVHAIVFLFLFLFFSSPGD